MWCKKDGEEKDRLEEDGEKKIVSRMKEGGREEFPPSFFVTQSAKVLGLCRIKPISGHFADPLLIDFHELITVCKWADICLIL